MCDGLKMTLALVLALATRSESLSAVDWLRTGAATAMASSKAKARTSVAGASGRLRDGARA